MELSIIIVNWNTKTLVIDCIKSIVNSKPNLNYEIIVVDNGSTDGSLDELSLLATKTKSVKIVVIANPKNVGYSKANNIGIKKAKGASVLLLNSDTLVKPNSIEALYNFSLTSKSIGAVVPKLLNTDESVQNSVYKTPTIARAISEFWLGKSKEFGLYAPNSKIPMEVEGAVMAAFLITKHALDRVGLLDEKFFMYYEDLDYCRRLRDCGLKIIYLPTAQVVHHLGASGKEVADPSVQWERLIPSSKLYHGVLKHYVINFVLWSGQKFVRFFSFSKNGSSSYKKD